MFPNIKNSASNQDLLLILLRMAVPIVVDGHYLGWQLTTLMFVLCTKLDTLSINKAKYAEELIDIYTFLISKKQVLKSFFNVKL